MGKFVRATREGGFDPTLARFAPVKGPLKERRAPILMPADATGTRYKNTVRSPDKILSSGHNNVKLGRDIRVGRFKGYWIYALSLEERKTCPSTCHHWRDCYGNNMPFAKRVDHTAPGFLPKLEAEIAALLAVRGRAGIMLRLHALGDFYSPEYVRFFDRMLTEHPRLAIFGYTARRKDRMIGATIDEMNRVHGPRSAIRFSDAPYAKMATRSIARAEDCPPDAFVCPSQMGKVQCCATCAACWQSDHNVAFLDH